MPDRLLAIALLGLAVLAVLNLAATAIAVSVMWRIEGASNKNLLDDDDYAHRRFMAAGPSISPQQADYEIDRQRHRARNFVSSIEIGKRIDSPSSQQTTYYLSAQLHPFIRQSAMECVKRGIEPVARAWCIECGRFQDDPIHQVPDDDGPRPA